MNRILRNLLPSKRHLSDDTLSCFLNDELDSLQSVRATTHLAGCWQCRVRCQQLEKAAHEVIEYRKLRVTPRLPQDPKRRASFIQQLDKMLIASPAPSWKASRTYFQPAINNMNPVLATALVVVFAVVMIFTIWQRSIPSVSAAELLNRAQTQEVAALHTSAPGVVYQKVRISNQNQTLERDLYRDQQSRRKSKLAAVAHETAPLQQEMQQAGVNWDDPLSAKSFKDWHDQQDIRSDEVKSSGKNLLTLTTSVADNFISQESFTVRQNDFHPVQRTIKLRNSGAIEIAELNYAVLNWNAVNESLFEPLPFPSFTSTTSRAAVASPAPVLPTASQLADAEMAARYALHQIGADLGTHVTFTLGTQQKHPAIIVQGVVDSTGKKQELLQALDSIPNLKPEFRTPDEIVVQQPTAVSPPAPTEAAKPANPKSPVQQQLLDHFASPEAVESFSERTLAATEALMSHVAALRRLQERYSATGGTPLSSLSPSSQELLSTMERDHRAAMREQTAQLRGLLDPVLPALASASTPASTDVTQQLSLFDSAQRTENLALYLLFGTELPDSMAQDKSPAQAAQALLAELAHLENQLQSGE